jgi:hypothetical protein
MVEKRKFNLDDVIANRVVFTGRGTGDFAKIRDIAYRELKKKEECIELPHLVRIVIAELGYDNPQQAYNYTVAALSSDDTFTSTKYKRRRIIVRTDGDKELAERIANNVA